MFRTLPSPPPCFEPGHAATYIPTSAATQEVSFTMSSVLRSTVSSLTLLTALAPLARAPLTWAEDPPKTWVDKDTGHRVWRLSDEANSGGFYFNINAYTPDHKSLLYTAPDGIHVLDMDTHKTRLPVPNPPATTAAQPTDGSAVRGARAGPNPHALVA